MKRVAPLLDSLTEGVKTKRDNNNCFSLISFASHIDTSAVNANGDANVTLKSLFTPKAILPNPGEKQGGALWGVHLADSISFSYPSMGSQDLEQTMVPLI